jgi:signal transduction histidine kinase
MNARKIVNQLLFCFTACTTGPVLVSGDLLADEIKIGLRAYRGAEQAIHKWQATADFLNKKIPEHHFVLQPYEINSKLNQAVSRDEFSFILTNPAAHVEQKIRYGVSAIATLINKRKGKGYTQFGSVVFTRSDRNDISQFHDLIGKKFMAADEIGFGGWRVAWREFKSVGINPIKDFSLLSFGGGIQQNVVFAVRDRKVDAGSVRTDLLERMAEQGEIELSNFKVIEPKITEGFSFLHSTRLYPEWPFAKAKRTPDDLARRVASLLYSIPEDSEAARKGKYIGWTLPLDYQPVDELLRELKVGPYVHTGQPSLLAIMRSYWHVIIAVCLLFIVITIANFLITRANRRMRKAHLELSEYREHLEEMIDERTASLKASNQELESYSYSIAHDLRSPLRTITSFSQVLVEDASDKLDDSELDALQRITRAGKNMANLIDDILELSRITRREISKEEINLSEISYEIAKNLELQSKYKKSEWRIHDNLLAKADATLTKILLQNLLENAYKFSSKAQHPIVEVGETQQAGKRIYFVRDNGVGFDMDYKDKLFKPFHRLHVDDFEGTGIGLATVQRIVQRHGGEVWAEGIPNKGATFYFTLGEEVEKRKSQA